jgi:hypothetical protein
MDDCSARGVRLFASCQASDMHQEMRRILDELEHVLLKRGKITPLLSYLEAQVLASENRDTKR